MKEDQSSLPMEDSNDMVNTGLGPDQKAIESQQFIMTNSINNEGQSTVNPTMNPVSNNVTNSNFDLHSPVI